MSANDEQGRQYWRSLRERGAGGDLRNDEFPADYWERDGAIDRREFWKLAGASVALAGLTGCTRQPLEKIVPYVEQPEQIVPGKPLFFATAMPLGGSAIGLLVESHMGRPTKVEGNPRHPGSLGATDAFAQASVLGLYDPDRSQVVTRMGRITSRVTLLEHINAALDTQRGSRGAGLRILTETVTSPTLANQLEALLAAFPAAKWHQYEPAGRDSARLGARMAFGQDANTYYRFDQAEVILSLDADFLCAGPGCVRYARDFAAKRRAPEGSAAMNRLYVVESTPSTTGAAADHRLPVRAGDIEGFARAVARGVGVAVDGGSDSKWIAALVRDLRGHRGSSVVVAGDGQPAVVHALAHAMNHALGNVGRTVVHTDPVEARPVDQTASLGELVTDMRAGRVETLIILGGNPVFTAPADFEFGENMNRVGLRVHLSLYQDETSALCQWHIPEAHFLESWSDARAYDGTASIIQPLIAPLYGGRSAHEVVAMLLGQPDRTGYEIVREYWKTRSGAGDFERFWRRALHDGVIAGTTAPPKAVAMKGSLPAPTASAETGGVEVVFRPDPTVWDGRFANNAWLQELPKPLTKLTWDNAALMSPATARRLGVTNGQAIGLRHQKRSVPTPVWVVPGHPDESVTVHFGYGRQRAGKVGSGTGFNAYSIRLSQQPWFASGVEIDPTTARHALASTQEHHGMEGRHPVRAGTLEEYRKDPEFAQKVGHTPPPGLTLYPEWKYEGYAWGMAIDLGACVGCNACMVACQAENNVPVVGKTEVGRGREMHWLRIDTYYEGDERNPETHHQPVPCMHCENAPCEVVCPVGATVHSSEGLNDMVYNRCVGTRYCSNNCPYKVRRFNFFHYSDYDTPSLKLMRNPDVTVRTRGVMEKCTYCVQRINSARIEAKKEDRKIRDGEVRTACQAACPTQAIVFGDINDPQSRVARLKRGPLNYSLLGDLNTRPRTTYLAKLRNPNPEIEGESA